MDGESIRGRQRERCLTHILPLRGNFLNSKPHSLSGWQIEWTRNMRAWPEGRDRMDSQRFPRRTCVALCLGLAVGLVTFAGSASGHSGGTDKYGCHAGSQPYHCHGGSGPPSGGGGGDYGGGSTSEYDSGPTAAERAALTEAQSDLANAKAEYTQSQSEVTAAQRELDKAEEVLKPQRDRVAKLRRTLDQSRREADRLRDDRIDQRAAAAKRVSLVAAKNEAAQTNYDSVRQFQLFWAALFAGFLLLRWVRRLAGIIVGHHWAWLLGGFIGSILWLAFSTGIESFAVGAIFAVIGGLVLSVTLMLARVWWIGRSLPTVVGAMLLVLAAVLAVGAVGGMTEVAEPVPAQPAATDRALVQEAKQDPAADDLPAAERIDQQAAKLEPQVAKLDAALAKAEKEADALQDQVEAARQDAATAKQDIAEAQAQVNALQ